jgi:GNAT superfamily N-acetyltransferase
MDDDRMIPFPVRSGSMKPASSFLPLSEELVPSAARLSAGAGWNQTGEDWRRLRRVQPGAVRVWVDDGEVRASCSVVSHGGSLAWIGMILTDPAWRGRGLGKQAFAEALEFARSGGHAVIALDATEMGEGIYRKFGFERIGPVTRWQGVFSGTEDGGRQTQLHRGLTPEVLVLDRDCTGVDRAVLLRDLAESAEIVRSGGEDKPLAYAAIRPGRNAVHVGPLVARSPEDARDLLCVLGARLGGQNVLCDVVRSGLDLSALGLRPSRHLQRMSLPVCGDFLQGEGVFLAAGLEWG